MQPTSHNGTQTPHVRATEGQYSVLL